MERRWIEKALACILAGSFIFVTEGCYTLQPIRRSAGPETYKRNDLQHSVRIGLNPQMYSNPDDESALGDFDVNLRRKKVMALLLEARKESDSNLRIMTSEAKLFTPDGREVPSVTSVLAARKARRSASLVLFPWVVPLISPLGIVVSALMRHRANDNMRNDFEARALPDPVLIPRDKAAIGYIYFILPERLPGTDGMRVTIPVVDSDTGERYLFSENL